LIQETPQKKNLSKKQIKSSNAKEKNKRTFSIRRVMHRSALVLPPESKLYVMVRNNTTPAHVSQG